jgi:hypothetical protein
MQIAPNVAASRHGKNQWQLPKVRYGELPTEGIRHHVMRTGVLSPTLVVSPGTRSRDNNDVGY